MDDEPDVTLTFKVGLDGYYYDKRRFDIYTYNNPVLALSEFKPNWIVWEDIGVRCQH